MAIKITPEIKDTLISGGFFKIVFMAFRNLKFQLDIG